MDEIVNYRINQLSHSEDESIPFSRKLMYFFEGLTGLWDEEEDGSLNN